MRLIDADMLLKEIENIYSQAWAGRDFAEIVQQQPTIKAESVKHGRWIIHREEIFEPNRSECYMSRPLPTECSVCGFAEMRASRFTFCPNCGAKMDGDKT